MSCLTKREWAEYPETANCERFDRHIDGCPRCSATREGLLHVRERLAEAAQRTGIRLAADEGALSRIWDGVRFRIRRAVNPAEEELRAMRLRQLRSILSALCGKATAEGALQRAGSRRDAPFASSLGSIVEVICGAQAGRLVEQAAAGVREDLVA